VTVAVVMIATSASFIVIASRADRAGRGSRCRLPRGNGAPHPAQV